MYPGSNTIRSISRECWIGSRISLKGVQILQRMALLVDFTYDFTEIPMKMILVAIWGWGQVNRGGGGGGGDSRELHCQRVPQLKELSATAKQRYCQDLSKQNFCQ